MMLTSTKHQYTNNIDIDTSTHEMMMPMTLLALPDKHKHSNAMASLEPPSTLPTMKHPSNPFNMPRLPDGPPQFTGHATA